jgi:hypothetical protein
LILELIAGFYKPQKGKIVSQTKGNHQPAYTGKGSWFAVPGFCHFSTLECF